MYTLKSIIRRSVALGMAVALFAATIVPTASVFADALNPLTDRSLTLSSGSPGWAFTDGSGNSTYAPPNSGANGQKTGNTFSFKVSSDSTSAPIEAFTFQYCTTSAGNCMGPGDNECATGTTGGGDCVRKTNAAALTDGDNTSDLEVVTDSPSQATFASHVNASNGNVTSVPAAGSTGNNFLVYYRTSDNGTPGNPEDDTWVTSNGWTMTTRVNQIYNGAPGDEGDGRSTNKNNFIVLANTSGQGFTAGQAVKIVFFGTDSNYITNPGSREFFVKINTYNEVDTTTTPGTPIVDAADLVDGGVTVANVMNESIQITTKVLETMDFSVGTVDPYTLAATGSAGSQLETAYPGHSLHGPCDPILKGMDPDDAVNTLQLGDEDGEFSLKTSDTYSTHSYWRLSSNSSAGATVYYSGVTLSNTVNDKIDAIGASATAPVVGAEQFGLALANGTGGNYEVNYGVERDSGKVFENAADNQAAGILAGTGVHSSVTDAGISNLTANASYHSPRLTTMQPTANYGNGAGVVNAEYIVPGGAPEDDTINTSFAFTETSNQIPVAVATEDDDVINCVTGKMRYIANIAATTPAGIYTTKINYIAAPQY